MAFPTPDSEFMPDDSELSSPSAAPSSALAALTESVRIAPPMTSVANARVPDDTNRYGSIGYDTVVGDGVNFPARKLKPRGATEAGWVLGAEPRPAQSESWQGSFVRPSLPDSAKELPLAPSSAAPFCGGGGGASSSSSSSNNPPRAPARAPPLPDHQRSHHRLAPAPHTGAVHRRGNIYNGQQRGSQSWVPPSPRGSHYGNQHHDERSGYGWHDPQVPVQNLYTGMPLPRMPGTGQPLMPQPTSPCVPYVYAPQRAQAQPPVSPMDYNGVASGYNAQFVTHPNPYASVPLDTYRMPFNNFQRPQPLTVAPSTISIRAPVDNRKLSLKRQIEYYFSVDNLCKDIFLRGKMDDQGWVPVSLIATFNMVKRVTTSTREILDALRDSTKLEIQAEKIRRREDWMRWLLPSMENPNGHGSMPHLTLNHDDSVIHPMQNLELGESSSQTIMSRTQTEVALDRGSASCSCNSQQDRDPSQLEELCHSGSDHEIGSDKS